MSFDDEHPDLHNDWYDDGDWLTPIQREIVFHMWEKLDREMMNMNSPDIWNHGPHQYSFRLKAGKKGEKGTIELRYSLFGLNGTTEAPRKGKPNASAWVTSRRRFANVAEAEDYFLHLVREQDKNND